MAADRLRVALIAGTLGQGGAEKQLYFLARALRNANVDVQLYSLTSGEFYESAFAQAEVTPIHFGQVDNPLLRLMRLIGLLRRFKPHVIHSGHYYTNLYAGLAGTALGALSTGSSRGDVHMELKANGRWGRLLLRLTDGMIANSENARQQMIALNRRADTVHVLNNVIDLRAFDFLSQSDVEDLPGEVRMGLVGRLVKVKQVEMFIDAVALARREMPGLWGYIVGDGPRMTILKDHAAHAGLNGDGLIFLGQRSDVPAVLKHLHALVLTSSHEGFPNVLLEGMAARLPVITTPAGDAGQIVQDGVTGMVTPHGDAEMLAQHMLTLARSDAQRAQYGQAGRALVERSYQPEGLAARMIAIQRELAALQERRGLVQVLESYHEPA